MSDPAPSDAGARNLTWHEGALSRADRPWMGSTVGLTGL